MRNVKTIAAALSIVAMMAASVGATSAYLSRSPGTVRNVITLGDVEIDLKEDTWDDVQKRTPDVPLETHPKQTLQKDPAIKNTGTNNCWVFLEVKVPVRNIHTVDESTKRKSDKAAPTELYTFTANSNWTQISKAMSGQDMVYVYGYKQELAPNATTPKLFENVKMVNFLDGDLEKNTDYSIQVNAKGIQNNLNTTNLSDIYAKFLEQEAAGV